MVNVILTLRIVQVVLAIIVLGLASYVVNFFNGYLLSAANFLVFNSIWSFFALGYLVATPMFFPNFHNRWAVLGVEAITMVFWFAGFIALAVDIPTLRCGKGSECAIGAAKAATTFGTFAWIAWACTLGLVVGALIQYKKSDPGNSDVETGITDPTGAPGGDAVTPSGVDVEMIGGLQFENEDDQQQQPPDTPPLPQLPEPTAGGEGHENQIDRHPQTGGNGTLQMPDVGQYGGSVTHVEQERY